MSSAFNLDEASDLRSFCYPNPAAAAPCRHYSWFPSCHHPCRRSWPFLHLPTSANMYGEGARGKHDLQSGQTPTADIHKTSDNRFSRYQLIHQSSSQSSGPSGASCVVGWTSSFSEFGWMVTTSVRRSICTMAPAALAARMMRSMSDCRKPARVMAWCSRLSRPLCP